MEPKKDLIFCCQIAGIYDVNRSETILNDDFSTVLNWYNSVLLHNMNGVIFHNSFSIPTCEKFENENIKFIKIDYNANFNPNIYRYFVYDNYLKENSKNINAVFFTDASDVVVLKNPFQLKIFFENSKSIFCGDEPKKLANDWMQQHSENLRNNITDFKYFEEKFKDFDLLNCGIFGGNINVMKLFIKHLWSIHEKHNANNKTLYTGDMGAFNYLMRTKYNDNIISGNPVNTIFKNYDIQNEDCWFAHK